MLGLVLMAQIFLGQILAPARLALPVPDLPQAPALPYEVIRAYPHDRQAFTQGLVYQEGVLFESTGLNGRSTLRRVDLETGRVLLEFRLSASYFAEGLALWRGRLVQLTWLSGIGFVYDAQSFVPLDYFAYAGEGWGLTHNGRQWIMSDGTDRLRFLNPLTFKTLRQLPVRDGQLAVSRLNELEYVRGRLFANVWPTDRIAIIDPTSGQVQGWLDLSGLLPAADRPGTDVLNGIAYDSDQDRLFVTGKWWPWLYEIRIPDF